VENLCPEFEDKNYQHILSKLNLRWVNLARIILPTLATITLNGANGSQSQSLDFYSQDRSTLRRNLGFLICFFSHAHLPNVHLNSIWQVWLFRTWYGLKELRRMIFAVLGHPVHCDALEHLNHHEFLWVYVRVSACVYVRVCVYVRAQKKGMPIHKHWFHWCKHNKDGSTEKRKKNYIFYSSSILYMNFILNFINYVFKLLRYWLMRILFLWISLRT